MIIDYLILNAVPGLKTLESEGRFLRRLRSPPAQGDWLPPADEWRQGGAPRPCERGGRRPRRRCRRGLGGGRGGLLVLLLFLEGRAVAPAGVALVQDDLEPLLLNFWFASTIQEGANNFANFQKSRLIQVYPWPVSPSCPGRLLPFNCPMHFFQLRRKYIYLINFSVLEV